MGIKLSCPNGHKLHVKSFLAGKRGICPHCGEKFWIPGDAEAAAAPGEASITTEEQIGNDTAENVSQAVRSHHPSVERTPKIVIEGPLKSRPEAVWYVRPPSGGQFGPAEVELMRSWLSEGRVAPDSQVWRDDWESWQRADQVFPHLAPDVEAGTAAPTPPEMPARTERSSADLSEDRVSTAGSGPTASAIELTTSRRHRATKKSRTMAVVVMFAVVVILFVLFLVVLLY